MAVMLFSDSAIEFLQFLDIDKVNVSSRAFFPHDQIVFCGDVYPKTRERPLLLIVRKTDEFGRRDQDIQA